MAEWRNIVSWLQKQKQSATDRYDDVKRKTVPFVKTHKKKIVLSLALLFTCAAGAQGSYMYYQSNVHTVYHVLVDGKKIGTVDQPTVVDQWIEDFKAQQREKFDGVKIHIPENITLQKEEKYKAEWDNESVLTALRDEIEVKAEAYKLTVDGEFIGYVKDKKIVENILTDIKNEYAEEEPQKKTSTVQAASLAEGTNSVVVEDVKIKEDVEIQPSEIDPEQVVDRDYVQKMLTKGTYEEQKYEIEEGDNLWYIAKKFDLTVEELLRNNPELEEDSILQIGQEINVTAFQPKLTVEVIEKETKIKSIAYQSEVKKDSSMYAGEQKILQHGKEGKKEVEYEVVKENGVEISREVFEETVIEEPVTQIIAKGTKVVPSRGTGSFRWPTYGGFITSGYGWRWGSMHKGIDISGVSNRSILAADNGKVVFAGWDGGYGKCIIIDHNNGYRTRYAHLSSIRVSSGQTVAKGQVIGVMGTTGHSTGVHLHFEIIKNGRALNPASFF